MDAAPNGVYELVDLSQGQPEVVGTVLLMVNPQDHTCGTLMWQSGRQLSALGAGPHELRLPRRAVGVAVKIAGVSGTSATVTLQHQSSAQQ